MKKIVIATALLSILTAASCGEKPINHGLIVDKSHYPEIVVNGERTAEHCTRTIQEDGTPRTGEVEIPCGELDFYNKGDRWLRKGYPSPSSEAKQ